MLSATAFVLLSAAPAAAQEDMFQMLGRMIFGTGTAKVAIDTPQAVSALEQADLDRAQPESISDLFKSVPGVQATGASTRPLGQAFNIRGIGNAEQTASETRIAVTVGGAPKFYESYRMGSFFGDLDLYKRVEVLRGAASSTLYGAGAIGGAIAFTTKDPADFLGEGDGTAVKFSAGYASNGEGLRTGVIWAQRKGNLEFLAALNNSEGGTKQDGNGEDIPGSKHSAQSGLVKGVLHLGQDETLTLSASRTQTDLDDAMVAMTGDLLFYGTTAASALDSFGTSDVAAVDDTVSLAWRKRDLTVQLSYTDTTVEKDNFSMASMCAAGSSQVLCDSNYGYRTTALKVEKQTEFSFGAWKNVLTTGAQISSQDRSATSTLGALPFHPEGTDAKLGLYAQSEMVWNDRLTLIPGVRVDLGRLTPSTEAEANGGAKADYTAISPKLAAMYKLTPEFSAFGSVAHTERMPSIDELYQYNAIAGRSPVRTTSMDLKKEQADTVELGLAWQRHGLLAEDDSLQVKLTAFHNDMTDKIVVTPSTQTAAGLPYYQNLAAAEIWGAELEAGYDAERWFAQVAYANIRSKDKDTGLTLADTPAQNLAVTLGAKFPVQHVVAGWRGQFYSDITTSSVATSADGYALHDLFITWSPEEGALAGLDVNFTLANVFDTAYRNNLTLDNGEGRNAKLTISKSFTW